MKSILSLCALICCLNPVMAAQGEDLEHPPLCEAVVHGDYAEFLFPILDVDEWRWYRTETQNDSLEYAWEIMVPADQPGYVFGIYLPKGSGELQQSGSLDQLLDQTRWNAVLLMADEQGEISPVALPRTQLSVDLKEGGVVLSLLGEETVQRFFQGRPGQALFNLVHPDEIFSINCVADIDYAQSAAADKPTRKPVWDVQLP